MANKKIITSVADLIAVIGRDTLTSELGHTPQVVSRAVTDGVMPAHWFVGIRDLCRRHGREVSESLFRWDRKTPSNTQIVNDGLTFQGGASADHGDAA